MVELITRAEYMEESRTDGPGAHRRYYAQFVSRSTMEQVVNHIGHATIMASTDKHMNDIPLRNWDRLHGILPIALPLKAVGESNSISTTVCIAKEAAKQYKEQNQ